MASVNGVSSSSTSSIYGNKNIISGLASGMDTESMIENSVAGYKTKINTLLQKQTKLSWKRDAFRSVTDKLIELSQKYTSYTSKTNLSSSSFFTGSTTTTTEGANASKVAATGKSSSEVQIKGVEQLATAAKYSISATGLDSNSQKTSASGAKINWGDPVQTSKVSGTLRLAFGSQDIALSFTDDEVFESAQEFVDAINKKLSEQTLTFSGGSTDKAGNRIQATLSDDGQIKFEHTGVGAANKLYISSVSGGLKDIVGDVDSTGKNPVTAFKTKITGDATEQQKLLVKNNNKTDYLSDQSISVTLDGVTKNIKIGKITGDTDDEKMTSLMKNLNEGIESAFGKNKITVEKDTTTGGLSFKMTDAAVNNTLSGLKVSASATVGEALGIGKSGISSYLNTGKTLEDLGLFKNVSDSNLSEIEGNAGTVDPTKFKTGGLKKADIKDAKDAAGNPVDLFYDKDNNLVRVDGEGKDAKLIRVEKGADGKYADMKGQKLTINGVEIGTFTKDSTMNDVINAINNNKDAGLKVNYSKISDKFTITATETGAAKGIEIKGTNDDGKTNLAAKIFGTIEHDTSGGVTVKDRNGVAADPKNYSYAAGQDAKFTITIDGEEHTLTRSTNKVDIDGLSVTLKGEFGYRDKADGSGKELDPTAEPVTFSTKADTSKITDALKSFVEEVNTVLKEIHDAYATQPAEKNKSKHTKYEPLTDEDKEGMSETAIKEYEDKAKQGILFGDSDLSALYSGLTSMLTTGSNGANLRAIGIDASLEGGVTVLSLDEEKLAAALAADPDKVKDTFANTTKGNGLMADMKKTLDRYANTSSASPGILVKKAGTTKSALSLLDNKMQDEMDEVDKQIDKWQSKMSDKIDYYTRQFTALETLMAQMNNQSSMLMGMMGGY